MNDKTTEAELVDEPQALIVRDPKQPVAEVRPMTAAQAKVDAVAALTMAAYAKASTLVLAVDEIEKLQAEFPDEAFKPGAGGKENLIYIEHAYLRDRMNQVFGPGQWAIVPRNRWAENFKTKGGDDAVKVYVEAMLCIRGCFAAEAIGDMDYFPKNAITNYGDACEGAKSAALRRCVKELGVGLQAWKKDWCEGWWERRRGTKNTRPPSSAAPANKAAPAPAEKPKQTTPAKTSDVLPKEATKKTRDWFLAEMANSGVDEAELLKFAIESGVLLDTEVLLDWPLEKVPTSRQAAAEVIKQFAAWQKGQYKADGADEPWRTTPIPGWSKHVKEEGFKTFGDLPKAKLWWWCVKWMPVGDNTGKVSESDFKLREMLDDVREAYDFEGED